MYNVTLTPKAQGTWWRNGQKKKIVRKEGQRDFCKIVSPRNVRRCTYKLSAVQLLKLAEQTKNNMSNWTGKSP